MLSRLGPSFLRASWGANITLSIETVLWMAFPCNLIVSEISDITLNGPRVFCCTFFSRAIAMGADSVFYAGGLSAKSGSPGWICIVCRRALSKLHLNHAWVEPSSASICLCRTSTWFIYRLQKVCSCEVFIMSSAFDGRLLCGPGGWRDSTRLSGIVPVDQCTWTLYAYFSNCTYWSWSVWGSEILCVGGVWRLLYWTVPLGHWSGVDRLLSSGVWFAKRAVQVAKVFVTICSLQSLIGYLCVQYRMTQLYTNTVAALVKGTVRTGMASIRVLYQSVRTITRWLLYFVLDNGSKCPLPEIQAMQQLETRVAISYEGFSNPVLARSVASHCVVCSVGPMRPKILR